MLQRQLKKNKNNNVAQPAGTVATGHEGNRRAARGSDKLTSKKIQSAS